MHFLTGKKQTPEHIAKRIKSRKSWVVSVGTREKLRQINLGKRYSDETKKKHSETSKRLGLKPPTHYGEAHPSWKGNTVGYAALHSWIRRKLGTPHICWMCKTTDAKRFNWANKSGKYLRNLDDWIRMCSKCHVNYDKASYKDSYKKGWITRRQNTST